MKLLNQNPKNRLGTKGEDNEVLSHPWFKDLDREKVIKK